MHEHTKEPWHVRDIRPQEIWAQRGPIALTCVRPEPEDAEPVEEYNARRIVAAVNATAGIPTAALEAGVVAELVEACKYAADTLQGGDRLASLEPWAQQIVGVLRGAIAKANKGAIRKATGEVPQRTPTA